MILWQPFASVVAGFTGRSSESLSQAGLKIEDLITLCQVHGDRMLAIRSSEEVARTAGQEGDSVVTTMPGIPIAVRTADCVPILIATAEGVIGAVHAGWKGTLAGVLSKTLDRMKTEFSVDLNTTRIAIGPAICGDCFEIGAEVASRFAANGDGEFLRPGSPGKYFLDLKRLNAKQARAVGIPDSHIKIETACTLCEESRFFSYRGAQRRGEENSGRNYAWILRKH